MENLINCVICKNEFPRKLTVLFDKNKYTLHGENAIQLDEIQIPKTTCKELHMQRMSFTTSAKYFMCILPFKCESTPV